MKSSSRCQWVSIGTVIMVIGLLMSLSTMVGIVRSNYDQEWMELGWLAWVIVIIGLVVFCAGWVVELKNKRKRDLTQEGKAESQRPDSNSN